MDLPPWLPVSILQEMVIIYRRRVSEILAKLRVAHGPGDDLDYGCSDIESDSGQTDTSKRSHPQSERQKTNSIFRIS